MASHTDAIGFLRSLRDEVSTDWFTYACDLAVAASNATVSPIHLERLVKLFLRAETYTPASPTAPISPTTPSGLSSTKTTFLEELSGFTNFKRLSPSLAVRFQKRVTVIFGTNGAGKSSLCKALKILARPNAPATPIHNVRANLPHSPSFSHLFRGAAATKWDSTHGYGNYATAIKYFDSKIAIARITESLEPEAVVEVAPFRLEVFSFCRSFTNALKDEMARRIAALQGQVNTTIQTITQSFAGLLPHNEQAITDLTRGAHASLRAALAAHRPLSVAEQMAAKENESALGRLLQATTEQGLRLLRTEVAALRELRNTLQQFYDFASKLSPAETQRQLAELASKVKTQQTLAASINPTGIHIEKFKQFLVAATGVFDFANEGEGPCPFCRGPLDAQAVTLIRQYRDFLTSTLEAEIRTLNGAIARSLAECATLKAFQFKANDVASGILSDEFKERLNDWIVYIKNVIPMTAEGFAQFDTTVYNNYKNLQPFIACLDQDIAKREGEIAAATADKATLDAEVARLKLAVLADRYRQHFAASYDHLAALLRDMERRDAMQGLVDITDFPTLLRKLTNLGKEAHRELVVGGFQSILDREYRALSAKGLADFGIQLKSRGEQQVISVDTAIGGTTIERVLSEGEQKIHALALFFSELTSKPSDIVVFDDPVTSFDYNYTATFSERLRNFIRDCPNSQVIVFTHNWDFFVQLQTMLNRSRLDHLLSVMVLENCDTIDEYKEDVDDLKCRAQLILSTAGDLSKQQKEQLSGYLRRMIEAVVNKHVFNGQRHQFKQKTLQVTAFHNFVKVVPLLPNEADTLRDRFADLSVAEHDDVRNAYVSKSKAVFQQWYDEIVSIETSILGRRP